MAYTVAEAEVRILPNADNFGELAKAEIDAQADEIGRSAGDRIAKGIQERVRAALAELPDAHIGIDVDQAKLDAALADVRAKATVAGDGAGRSLGSQLGRSAASEAGHSSPLIVAAIGAGLIAGAPVLIAAGGLLMGGLAAVIQHNQPQIQHAAVGVANAFTDSFGRATQVDIPYFVQALGDVQDAAETLAQTAAPAFASLGGPIHDVTHGIIDMTQNALTGLTRALQTGEPVFAGFRTLLAEIGQGLGDMFTIMSQHAGAAGTVFSSLGSILGALLPILGQLVSAGAELGAVILPPLAAVLQFVASALDALSPILPGVIAGFLALKVASALEGPLTTLATKLETVGASTMVAVAEMTGVEAAGAAAGTGFELAATGARGLETALGPIGWAIAALSIVVPLLAQAFGRQDDAQKKVTVSSTQLTQALKASGGAITDNVRQAAAAEAQAKGVLSAMEAAGLSTTQVVPAILGQGNAYNEVVGAMEMYVNQHTYVDGTQDKTAGKVNAMIPIMASLAGEYSSGATGAQQLARALDEAAPSEQDNANRLQGMSNAASSANTQIGLLKGALDALTGKQVSETDAQVAVTTAVLQAKEALKGHTGALWDATAGTVAQTDAGTAAWGALTRLKDADNTLIGTMEAHGATADTVATKDAALRDQFIQTAEKMGYSATQANNLADQILGIPGERKTEIIADTTIASGNIEAIKTQLAELRDKSVTITVQERRMYAMTNAGPALAGGGAIGGIARFADGGTFPSLFPMAGNVATVVPPNTWRVIGDNPTSDEAYIPINSSARSLAILAQTAGRMGFGLAQQTAGSSAGPAAGKVDARTYTFNIAGASAPQALARQIRDAQLDMEFLHG